MTVLVLSKYTHIQIIYNLHNENLLKYGFIDNQLVVCLNC